jgi:hypothetical protein
MPGINPGTNTLKAWWQLNEASGNALDSHGANAMTDNGTVTSSADATHGTVRTFNRAIPEFFSINDNADISTGDTDWTLGVFLRKHDDVIGDIFDKYNGASGGGMASFYYNGAGHRSIRFDVYSGATLRGTVESNAESIQLNTWYLVVMYHSATANQVGVSINAAAYKTASTTGAIADGAALGLGKRVASGTHGFDGDMSIAFKYDKILSVDECAWLFNGGKGRVYADFFPRLYNHRGINLLGRHGRRLVY